MFEVHCAACHGPTGSGGYIAPSMRPPAIAGADIARIVDHVRKGGKEMPPFPAAILSDASLGDVASHVHDTLAKTSSPARFGPRDIDPFFVGVLVWVALMLLTLGIAALFAGERR
jgi:mono/diheme cytochrome c family protein